MAGILYGIGVGPGDPELMTLKAVRLIRQSRVIAVPGAEPEKTVAYRIAVQAVPEIKEKELVPVLMPMTHDRGELERSHARAAALLAGYLERGIDVAFLTLGDPTVYSTYLYVQERAEELGYRTELVSGVPSFCAAAARAGIPLAEWDQQLHVFPASHGLSHEPGLPGTYVLMKAGKKMRQVKEALRRSGRQAVMVENCGMEGEKLYRNLDEIPDDAGYYSLIIAKEGRA